MPKINKPEKNPLGDFKRLSDGVLIDLKSPTGGGKWVIQGQVDDHKDQAKHFIIDISKSKIGNNLNEVFRQTEEVMNRDRLEWIQEIMLIKDEKIIRVYERI